jgi:hypothetical protein
MCWISPRATEAACTGTTGPLSAGGFEQLTADSMRVSPMQQIANFPDNPEIARVDPIPIVLLFIGLETTG